MADNTESVGSSEGTNAAATPSSPEKSKEGKHESKPNEVGNLDDICII